MTFDEADRRIRELADQDFLKKLTEIHRCSWGGDTVAVAEFVNEVHVIAEIDIADEELEPYELHESKQ